MKTEIKHINFIQAAFKEMKSRKDFLNLLNYAKPLVYGDDCKLFELKQLSYYSNPKNTNKAYKEFKIKKKSGAVRIIYAPENGLKAIQKTLALILQCVFSPHKAATGFVIGKSIIDNAKVHTGQNYVYNIDLKDFFPSIDQARVWACLKLQPFGLVSDPNLPSELDTGVRKFTTSNNEVIFYKIISGRVRLIHDKAGHCSAYLSRLKGENIDYRRDAAGYISKTKNLKALTIDRGNIASLIAVLSCAEVTTERINEEGVWEKVKRNTLPQGAPTSPVLSNIVCNKLDKRLAGVAKRFNLNYTRYADDITFSSMHNVYVENGTFLKELSRVIIDQGFHIKASKTRLQKTGFRQEVTGLVVNDLVNVRKRYVKQIRMWLYYWEKYGYTKAESIFLKDYSVDKGHVKNKKANFINVLSGKLEYLKMVKGADNSVYLKLRSRFDLLMSKDSDLEKLLSIWESEGIEKAMALYQLKQ